MNQYPSDSTSGGSFLDENRSMPIFVPGSGKVFVTVPRNAEVIEYQRNSMWPVERWRLCKILPFHFYVPETMSDFEAAHLLVR